MLRRTLPFLLLAILASGMLFAADKATALKAADADWSKAALARDIDKVASYYAENAKVYPPNAAAITGRAGAREIWAQFLAAPTTKMSWTTTDAGVAGKTGWTAGTYHLEMVGADGKPVIEDGKYLCVWEQGQDGKWHAIHDMWNSNNK